MDSFNGIVIVNKEKGYTSHDVVNVIRRIFSTRKVGHTGTLDPDATGVLPICIGKATKVSDMLTVSDKCYVAKVRLGITTDTQDISGEVIATSAVDVRLEKLKEAADRFTGEIMQVPPMYSAIKIGGKKLCDLARKGIEVERNPRKITVYSADISDFDGTDFTINVHCSKGTYIRTLCNDIGSYLGCGATMTELVRTKSSVFSIDDAYTLDELKNMDEASLKSCLMSIDTVFGTYPRFNIADSLKKRLCNGAPCYVNINSGTYRVYDADGTFLCIIKTEGEGDKKLLKLVKTFY